MGTFNVKFNLICYGSIILHRFGRFLILIRFFCRFAAQIATHLSIIATSTTTRIPAVITSRGHEVWPIFFLFRGSVARISEMKPNPIYARIHPPVICCRLLIADRVV